MPLLLKYTVDRTYVNMSTQHQHGNSAIQSAACDGFIELATLLLDRGANVNAEDNVRLSYIIIIPTCSKMNITDYSAARDCTAQYCHFDCNTRLECTVNVIQCYNTMLCDVWISQWCQWLSICSISISAYWYLISCDVISCYVTWHCYFNCMTLSIMTTIKQRHIAYSIYQYLPIHRQDGDRAL